MFDPLQTLFGIKLCHPTSPVLWWIYNISIAWIFGAVPLIWLLCRFRVAPTFLMRGWFVLVMIWTIISTRVACEIVNLIFHVILGKTKDQTTWHHATVCKVTFRLQTLLCPQIQVKGCDKDSWKMLNELPERAFICLNHTSQYDPFVFVGYMPHQIITTCRTLFKHSLTKIPIFGKVYEYCGHFPVYFKGGDSFSVEAEKQKIVSDNMIEFVDKQKGRLSMFPEGQLNKNVRTLQPFRYGSLKFALEHKMPIYFFVLWGPQDTWPVAEAVGGHAADIYFAIQKFEVKDYDAEMADLNTFASRMQSEMQTVVDKFANNNNTISGGDKKND